MDPILNQAFDWWLFDTWGEVISKIEYHISSLFHRGSLTMKTHKQLKAPLENHRRGRYFMMFIGL